MMFVCGCRVWNETSVRPMPRYKSWRRSSRKQTIRRFISHKEAHVLKAKKSNRQDATLRNDRATKKNVLNLVDALRDLSAVAAQGRLSSSERRGLRKAEMRLRRIERWAGRK